jgi:hypothetical protein
MTPSRVQEAIKILKTSADELNYEEKPKPRKKAKGKTKKPAIRKPR